MTYLQNKYGKDDSLYPKDPKKRAVIDQRLYFDMDMCSRFYQVYVSRYAQVASRFSCFNITYVILFWIIFVCIFQNRNTLGAPPDPEKLKSVNQSLELLDKFLEKSEFVAGDHLTLADLSIVVQISNLEVIKHDISSYKYINRWYDKVKLTAPGYKEANEDHLVVVKQMIEMFSKRL